MKLNKECMKTIIQFIIDNMNNGEDVEHAPSILFGHVCSRIEQTSDFSQAEIEVHMQRCINEGFIYATESRIPDTREILDVSLKGFEWLEEQSK